MRVLLFKGKSVVSRLIQWQTRSPYSHVAVELDDGRIIEAWHIGGVSMYKDRAAMAVYHEVGTEIDVYKPWALTAAQALNVERFLVSQVGKKYDFRSVFRFVSRRSAKENDKWFCSELVAEAFKYAGYPLLHGEAANFSPRDIAMSPNLALVERITI